MTQHRLEEDDALEDFAHREITLDGVSKVVHVAGTGPAVIVLSEMPGSPRWRRETRSWRSWFAASSNPGPRRRTHAMRSRRTR